VPSETQFDSLFNKALKTGVDKGDFSQPKGESFQPDLVFNTDSTGPSGPVKIAKKEAKPAAEKKAAAPKVRAYPFYLDPVN
jgi:histone H1/5